MPVHRQVDRLRIRSSSHEQAQRQSVLLEDALRTASFANLPLTGLVLIRRLDLGRVPLCAGSVALSRLIDARLLSTRPELVNLGSEEHPAAPVVWFADDLEPLILFAGLLARGVEPRSWYWQRLVPGWRPGTQRINAARLVWQAVVGLDTVPTAVMQLTNVLVKTGLLHGFLSLVPAAELPPVQLPHATALPRPGSPRQAVMPFLAPAWRHALSSVRFDDDKISWLARMALAACCTTADEESLTDLLAECAARYVEKGAGIATDPAGERVVKIRQPTAQPQGDPTHEEAVAEVQIPRIDRLSDGWQQTAVAASEKVRKDGAPMPRRDSAGYAEIPGPGAVDHVTSCRGLASANAGLALVVRLMQMLDIHEALSQETSLAGCNLQFLLLRAVAHRCCIGADDPIMEILPERLPVETTLLFQPPLRWAALFPVVNGTPVTAERVVGAWLLAMARFLRRYARLSIGALVCRPGQVAVGRTHLDVAFNSRLVDLRIRRAGLDLDPGWVPWLGRVVTFHYDYNTVIPGR